jgi:hypothetical protein
MDGACDVSRGDFVDCGGRGGGLVRGGPAMASDVRAHAGLSREARSLRSRHRQSRGPQNFFGRFKEVEAELLRDAGQLTNVLEEQNSSASASRTS